MSLPGTQPPRSGGAPSRPERPPTRERFEEVLARARAGERPERPLRSAAARHLCIRSAPPPPSPAGREPEAAAAGPWLRTDPRLDPPPGIPELQAAVRAAPATIAAALRQGQAQLALSFGAALSVDLRAGAQGLEVSLRPAPSLERAARAELPRLVEALRARGLRVARADVRAAPARPPARPR